MPAVAPAPVVTVAAPAPATTIQQQLATDFAAVASVTPVVPTAPDPQTAAPVDGAAPASAPDAAATAAVPGVDPPTETPIDEFADITPDSVSEDGKRFFYNATKKGRLETDHRLARELREVIPDLSVDAVRKLAARANSAELLMSHFRNGPNEIGSMDTVLSEFVVDPHAFGVMAIRAANVLNSVNPQAAQALRSAQNMQFLNDSRARLTQIQDPAAREQEAIFIQNLEKRTLGRFTPMAELLAGAQQDPAAAERNWIESQKREIANFQQQQQTLQKNSRIQTLNQAEDSAIQSQIGSVLDPLKANYKPEQIAFMKSQLENHIRDAEEAHPEWGRQYQVLRFEAERTGAPNAIKALADFRQGISRQVIARNSASVIQQQTALAMANNQAAHAAAASVPTTELSPNGVTAPPPNGAADAMLKAKTWDQVFAAMKGQAR